VFRGANVSGRFSLEREEMDIHMNLNWASEDWTCKHNITKFTFINASFKRRKDQVAGNNIYPGYARFEYSQSSDVDRLTFDIRFNGSNRIRQAVMFSTFYVPKPFVRFKK